MRTLFILYMLGQELREAINDVAHNFARGEEQKTNERGMVSRSRVIHRFNQAAI